LAKFRYEYLGTTITDKNCISEEIQSMFNEGPFSSECFIFLAATKKWEIKIYRTSILPHVLHGSKTWFLLFIGEQ